MANKILQADRTGSRLMTEALASEGTLAQGADRRAVLYLERALKVLGFDPGVKDNKFTAKTAEALKKFQGAWGLEQTGALDKATLNKLDHTLGRVRKHGSGCPDCEKKGFQGAVGVGQKSRDIFVVEKRLETLGYKVGKADGLFDQDTAKAVSAFKRDQKELKGDSALFGQQAYRVLARELGDLAHVPFRIRVLKDHKARRREEANVERVLKEKKTIAEGLHGASVKTIQRRLKHAGFDPQRYDGRFDERTSGAVRAFQRRSNLPETGVVDGRTWRALEKTFLYAKGSADPMQRAGERSAAVLRTEKILRKLGYKSVKADGLYDAKTASAVRRFEKKHDLNVDGAVGTEQLGKMKRVLANQEAMAGARRVDAYVRGSRRRITVLPAGNGEYLRKDAALQYRKLMTAAKKAGVYLSTNSGFRSMAEQRELYRRYLNGTGATAARPGYSNHQNGIAVDIGGVGPFGSRAYNWLANNAGRFGFSNAEGRGVGEPWHWVYVR